jgi:uncharacterized protein (TIGR02246 family)
MTDLLQLEQQGWEALAAGRGAEFYERVMAEDAVTVVPGMVLDRRQPLASRQGVTPWSEYRLRGQRVIMLGRDAALITYEVTASRPGDERPYHAQLTSVYVATADGDWRLALHQQTPLP